MEIQPTNLYGVIANFRIDSLNHCFRRGAKVWLIRLCGGENAGDRAKFVGLSPGGRVIECYAAFKNLENFRSAWIPQHLRDRVFFGYEDRREADGWAADFRDRGIDHAA